MISGGDGGAEDAKLKLPQGDGETFCGNDMSKLMKGGGNEGGKGEGGWGDNKRAEDKDSEKTYFDLHK